MAWDLEFPHSPKAHNRFGFGIVLVCPGLQINILNNSPELLNTVSRTSMCRFEALGKERWGWTAQEAEAKWVDALADLLAPKDTRTPRAGRPLSSRRRQLYLLRGL